MHWVEWSGWTDFFIVSDEDETDNPGVQPCFKGRRKRERKCNAVPPNGQPGYEPVEFGDSCSDDKAKDHIIFEWSGDSEIEWDYAYENEEEAVKSCIWGAWAQASMVWS